jgi:hypothetical protein
MSRDLVTVASGVILLALVGLLWWEGARQSFTVLGAGIAYDPMFFPRVLLALGGLCAAGIVVLGLTAPPEDREEPRWGLWCGLVLLVGGYFWAMAEIGFATATVPFVLAFCALLGYRRWLIAVPAAIGITAAVWYAFTAWLRVPLPSAGWLEGLF